MSSENPYQSPQQDGGSIPSQSGGGATMSTLELFFSFRGRIPRRSFWAASIATVVVFYVVVFAAFFAFGEESPIANITLFAAYIPALWSSWAIQAKRWHDLDKSGLWILITFIPIIGPLWALIENGFLRGTHGANSYGQDPT